MRKMLSSLSIFVLTLFATVAFAAPVSEILKNPQVKAIEKISNNYYQQAYLLWIEQPVDHKNPEVGTFRQRVFLYHVDESLPTVFITEGYSADRGLNPMFREEISTMLQTNLVFAEHRYFSESTPTNDPEYKYMNAYNAASDHHNIFSILKPLYSNKWIATGISKGGQTALMYRAFYPNDADITVPYVAPLCKGVEDGRHEPFLAKKVGTAKERKLITEYQKELLKRKKEILPELKKVVEEVGIEKYNISISDIYDYCVLEFPFAWWQWGRDINQIPNTSATNEQLLSILLETSGPDYFANQSPTGSFFIQAAKELGYYGYDLAPFKGLIDLPSTKGYLSRVFTPKELNLEFNKELYDFVANFVATTDLKMIFIYGEYDPWSAVMINDPKKENIKIYIEPKGSHRARISTLPQQMRNEAIQTLKEWLK